MKNQPDHFALAAVLTIAFWSIMLFAAQPAHARTDQNRMIFETVSSGDAHTCGIRNDGTLSCWGNDWYGQATPLTGLFTQVSSGGLHTCAVKSSGAYVCWGNNDYGQSTPPPLNIFIPLVSKM